ncbi:MAG: class I SAM-dependent methyltransferase [Prevotellaceae bacterium]|jgi:2-polyprenyl-3-methyl-5-hydroxy-6-metoxy-1,4-benzoquinol methylase|nr:class I SAM-dependent methyltransferase [Prevotellaceae bacterium]
MQKTIHLDKCPVCGSAEIAVFEYCADYLTDNGLFSLCKCHSCGFVFTQDFPAEDEIGKYYLSENYTSHHEAKGLFGFAYKTVRSIMLNKKAALVRRFAKKGKILDIGSGQGFFLHKMQTKGFEVAGIEKSEEVRVFAGKKFGIEVKAPETLGKQPAGNFDVVTMWHSLEHIEHLSETLQQVHRVLKDDGTLIIALPNVKSYDHDHYRFYWAAYDVPRHLWHFSPETFKILAQKNGFDIKKQKPMLFDVFYISLLSERNKKSSERNRHLHHPVCRALLFGLWACLKTLVKPEKASSIIYVLKKK